MLRLRKTEDVGIQKVLKYQIEFAFLITSQHFLCLNEATSTLLPLPKKFSRCKKNGFPPSSINKTKQKKYKRKKKENYFKFVDVGLV